MLSCKFMWLDNPVLLSWAIRMPSCIWFCLYSWFAYTLGWNNCQNNFLRFLIIFARFSSRNSYKETLILQQILPNFIHVKIIHRFFPKEKKERNNIKVPGNTSKCTKKELTHSFSHEIREIFLFQNICKSSFSII